MRQRFTCAHQGTFRLTCLGHHPPGPSPAGLFSSAPWPLVDWPPTSRSPLQYYTASWLWCLDSSNAVLCSAGALGAYWSHAQQSDCSCLGWHYRCRFIALTSGPPSRARAHGESGCQWSAATQNRVRHLRISDHNAASDRYQDAPS